MRRGLAGGVAVLLAFGALLTLQASSAGASPAQSVACFPGTDPDYPPTGNNGQLEPLGLVNGQFNPGASGNVTINGADAGDTYCGFIFSHPITLLPQVANAQGQVTWNFAVPSDFQLNAVHHMDVYKLQSRVGSFDFCVGTSGAIVPLATCRPGTSQTTSTTSTTITSPSSTNQVQGGSKTSTAPSTTPSGKLPRTGGDSLGFLQAAMLAIGLGAGLMYLRRRRAARFAS